MAFGHILHCLHKPRKATGLGEYVPESLNPVHEFSLYIP